MDTHTPGVPDQGSETPGREDGPFTSERPTFADTLGQVAPLITAPAFFGPPVIFVLGPWLLLVLLLIGPVALLITFVILAAVAAGLLVALVALIASPYLLVRHLRERHATASPAPAVSEVGGVRGERPVTRPVRPRLIHLTSR
jgi:hypothetical protein